MLTPLNVLRSCLIAIAFFWILLSVSSFGGDDTKSTFSITFFSCLLTLYLLLYFLYSRRFLSFQLFLLVLTFFILRVLLGVYHYLALFDDNYFNVSSPVLNIGLWDYESLDYSMALLANTWNDYGFLKNTTDYLVSNKNTWLHPYLALLYYLPNNTHFLNIAILNSFHSTLVALVVAGYAYKYAALNFNNIFLIALMQPFGLISSVMWRDTVGQFFFISGLILIAEYSGRIRAFYQPVIGAILLMSLRNVYFIIVIIIFLFRAVATKSIKKLNSGFTVAAIVLIIIGSDYAIPYLTLSDRHSYSDLLSLPKKIVVAFIGPFPWTQIFDVNIAAREYLIQDILQALYASSIWVLFIIKFKWAHLQSIIFSMSQKTILLGIILVTTMSALSFGYVTYVTVGTVLLLPFLVTVKLYEFFALFVGLVIFHFIFGLFW